MLYVGGVRVKRGSSASNPAIRATTTGIGCRLPIADAKAVLARFDLFHDGIAHGRRVGRAARTVALRRCPVGHRAPITLDVGGQIVLGQVK